MSKTKKTIGRSPVHVVYGGANLFTTETPTKLGKIALRSIEVYAPGTNDFASAIGLDGDAKILAAVYKKTIEKLRREPVEDFRIDFEDGYGFRPDDEEDTDALASSSELAQSFLLNTITPFSGVRIKSFAPETRDRAKRTLQLFLDNFLQRSEGKLPPQISW